MRDGWVFFAAAVIIGAGVFLGRLYAPEPPNGYSFSPLAAASAVPSGKKTKTTGKAAPAAPVAAAGKNNKDKTAVPSPEKKPERPALFDDSRPEEALPVERPLTALEKAWLSGLLRKFGAPKEQQAANSPLFELTVCELRRRKLLEDPARAQRLVKEIVGRLAAVTFVRVSNGTRPQIAARKYVAVLVGGGEIPRAKAAEAMDRIKREAAAKGVPPDKLPVRYRARILLEHYLKLLLPRVRKNGWEWLNKVKADPRELSKGH